MLVVSTGEKHIGNLSRSLALACALLCLGVSLQAQTNTFPSSGNVGIGTVSPAYPLDIVGNVARISGGSFADFSMLATGTGGREYRIGSTDNSNGLGGGMWVLYDQTGGAARLVVNATGNIGIGTAAPQYPLSVNGTIQAKEVLVNTGWSDYVFDPSYRLAPLAEVAAFVEQHHRLPEIPSAAEVAEKGISVGEMQAKLLAKIEELTLHMIQEHENSARLESENRGLRSRLLRVEEELKRK